MKWKCDRCGHEQPRHPDTKPEEMPDCTQFLWNRTNAEGNHYCGGRPQPIDDDPRFRHSVGEVVSVKAWWWNDTRLVKCRIEQTHKGGEFYTVRPVDSPGAHERFIKTIRDL
jgi:hypothetical protein